MKQHFLLLFLFISKFTTAFSQTEPPQQTLNQYVEFLNQSVEVVTSRFKMLREHKEDIDRYKKNPDFGLRLPSSGPLEEFYYQKALSGNGITSSEKQRLNADAKAIWQVVNQLDETGKALETHVRLNAYKDDNLKQSDAYISAMQSLFGKFSQENAVFYKRIKEVYVRYQPHQATDPYLNTEKEMAMALLSQQQLLDSLPYYLHSENRAEWPVALVQRSMLADEKLLAELGKSKAKLTYPASDVIPDFKAALQAMQSLKQRALDDYNFTARQSAQHGNEVYMALLNQYNHDLVAMHKSFVSYSQSARRMLNYSTFSPVITQETATPAKQEGKKTAAFQDKPLIDFKTKIASSPAPPATNNTLNGYVEFINESLRQMHLLQVLTRNYQSSAEYYRDPARSQKRAGLTYSHDDFKIPLSTYQLLMNARNSIPQPCRASITSQAEVLLNMLKEMDELSIELIQYTNGKQYLTDHLQRSDAILDRYALLFDLFDQKKEQLYNDVRRVHESFPNPAPTSSWYVAGSALLKTFDDNKETMFAVKAFFKEEKTQKPATDKLEAGAKQLIANEYQNMKGLKRYGRSNGLCPYSPYEDLAGNSSRFAEKAQKVKTVTSGTSAHPYESFYYFYNNELVYQYNKFVELANAGLLKTVNQPDVFAFHRLPNQKSPETPDNRPIDDILVNSKPDTKTVIAEKPPVPEPSKPATDVPIMVKRDTVFVERVRVDTVYVDRAAGQPDGNRSLAGFAHNNMVLLLDVSSSMNSPYKMPLLKRSIKSLLTLLRPEDQISIVLYSGKARVVLKPTSGAKSAEISRMIDLLQSDGDTDGNEGIRLAYKTANKQYIRGGNNRIILATDGEFPVSDEVFQLIGENARKDVYLTVFTFGRNEHTGQKLRKLSNLGQGTYAHVTAETADSQLILEAQAKKQTQ
ncbi:vWA domain-containing protein [Dyadobacter arcticus]|uniref:VWFA domain-containing protein n=1 Tax=Dyadobacter arcticus TaxID=1078754 RepID=A0ABX0UK54_9BACT|nr:VWA domain-containing protein [Dyadobacter arcticus]NIJ52843.1 hypothetical protein [Dyadobacter arcticus]